MQYYGKYSRVQGLMVAFVFRAMKASRWNAEEGKQNQTESGIISNESTCAAAAATHAPHQLCGKAGELALARMLRPSGPPRKRPAFDEHARAAAFRHSSQPAQRLILRTSTRRCGQRSI